MGLDAHRLGVCCKTQLEYKAGQFVDGDRE